MSKRAKRLWIITSTIIGLILEFWMFVASSNTPEDVSARTLRWWEAVKMHKYAAIGVALAWLVVCLFILFMKDKKRRLSAQIHSPIFKANNDMDCLTVIRITVRNHDEPSIAENWKVIATLEDGQKIGATLLTIKAPITILPPGDDTAKFIRHGKATEISQDDTIVAKTSSPIAKGAAVTAYLVLRFFGHSFSEFDGAEYSVEFSDIDGTSYSCTGR